MADIKRGPDGLVVVTDKNYYSKEANMDYMGSTQFKAFKSCEARALAICRGEYVEQSKEAFLLGGYIDAHFAGEMEDFKENHPDMFKRDGSLKANFQHADEVIKKMESDRLYSLLMSGKKQVIRTGKIAGVPFKIRIDSLLSPETCATIAQEFPGAAPALGFCDGAIIDQKYMKDLGLVWSGEAHAKVSFVEAFGYDIQGAIYQEIEGHLLPFILAPGTKEDGIGLAALSIPNDVLEERLAEVMEYAPRFQAIKQGRIAPKRCENCEYCRMTRKLDKIIDYRMLYAKEDEE